MTIHQPPTTGILHLSKLLLTLAQLLQAHGHVLRGWSDGRIVLGGVELIPSLGHNLIGKWPKIRMVERSFHWFCKYLPTQYGLYVRTIKTACEKDMGKKGCSIRFHMFGEETYSETSGSRSSFQYQVYNCIKSEEVVDILLLSQATHKKLRIG